MRETLPEIARLQMLIEGIANDPAATKQIALVVVVGHYSSLFEEDLSNEEALYVLLRSINELPILIDQQFPEGGRKKRP